jgi:hypothetical protein
VSPELFGDGIRLIEQAAVAEGRAPRREEGRQIGP